MEEQLLGMKVILSINLMIHQSSLVSQHIQQTITGRTPCESHFLGLFSLLAPIRDPNAIAFS